jgi:septal ring factor EnvC (AmiA/AmiB activator)
VAPDAALSADVDTLSRLLALRKVEVLHSVVCEVKMWRIAKEADIKSHEVTLAAHKLRFDVIDTQTAAVSEEIQRLERQMKELRQNLKRLQDEREAAIYAQSTDADKHLRRVERIRLTATALTAGVSLVL